jgi:uroporphyrin-III C-methyltransferase
MANGKVYLVGAGPGHPELLTIKAARLLGDADVVVYDRLIQEEVLSLARPSAEKIYMGKPVGKHDSRQDEIHELLCAKAREGKRVVRLKGGDPFLFGRGGEEAEYLAEHGIEFEVIPGVSSALAAPLSAGIAVTHREASSCVTIATGHFALDKDPQMDWEALARLETLVFLMGVKNLKRISDKLIQNGRDPKTPAALIQTAYWHGEKVVTATLETIAEVAEKEGIEPPSTLVIGEVVKLREKLKDVSRELKRRHDEGSRFQPGPSPDQLLRLALGGLASEALGIALELNLFDRLETYLSPAELAKEFKFDSAALREFLEALCSMGLIEEKDGKYRNLDMTSRFLCSASEASLRPLFLQMALDMPGREPLERFLSHGYSGGPKPDGPLHQACESLASFCAPAVVEKLEMKDGCRVLHFGWGGAAFGRAVSSRWPRSRFKTITPSEGDSCGLMESASFLDGNGEWDAIVISGVSSSCRQEEFKRVLEAGARHVAPGGMVVVHDAFLRQGSLPPSEVVLCALGRRVGLGGCWPWSTGQAEAFFSSLGLVGFAFHQIGGGTSLAIARRPC